MPKNILLIDDDKDDRNFFCMAIAKISDAKCIALGNGNLMLEKIFKGEIEKPDLIFLDVNMPEVDGWECLKHLKGIQEYSDIPVFIYSTSRREEDIFRAKKLGAINFLTKPCDYIMLKKGLALILDQLAENNIHVLSDYSDLFD